MGRLIWGRVPNHVKVNAVLWPLLVLGAAAAFAGGLLAHAPVIHHTHTARVEKSWGRATESVDGAQVGQALAGLTCDVYQARKTVVCHP